MKKTVLMCDFHEREYNAAFVALFHAAKVELQLCSKPSEIPDDAFLLIISEQFLLPHDCHILQPVIVSSDEISVLHQLTYSETPVYTCGFHKKDCLSYSSMLSEDCILSLNRPICTFSGMRIEPFELSVKGANELWPPFSLPALVLTLLLNDILPEKLVE